jgi:TRAP transporter TAXI family solute receptor
MAKLDRTAWLAIYGPLLLVMLVGFFVAYQFVEPAPPRTFTLATGGVDGAYHLYGQRYRDLLARDGITVELRNTAGSVENLALLRAGEVDVALVQGGLAAPADGELLEGLASLYHEPLWVFHTLGDDLVDLRGLAGKHLAVGAEGSGTRAVALPLLGQNGIDAVSAVLRDVGGAAAVEALRSGVVDAAFFVAAPSAPLIADLLRDSQVQLLGFSRAEAYTRRFGGAAARLLSRRGLHAAVRLPFEGDARRWPGGLGQGHARGRRAAGRADREPGRLHRIPPGAGDAAAAGCQCGPCGR